MPQYRIRIPSNEGGEELSTQQRPIYLISIEDGILLLPTGFPVDLLGLSQTTVTKVKDDHYQIVLAAMTDRTEQSSIRAFFDKCSFHPVHDPNMTSDIEKGKCQRVLSGSFPDAPNRWGIVVSLFYMVAFLAVAIFAAGIFAAALSPSLPGVGFFAQAAEFIGLGVPDIFLDFANFDALLSSMASMGFDEWALMGIMAISSIVVIFAIIALVKSLGDTQPSVASGALAEERSLTASEQAAAADSDMLGMLDSGENLVDGSVIVQDAQFSLFDCFTRPIQRVLEKISADASEESSTSHDRNGQDSFLV